MDLALMNPADPAPADELGSLAPDAPLVVTGDADLLQELLPLTAAADLAPEVVDTAERALLGWSRASIVLVGLDRAADVAALRPEDRAHVYLVAAGTVPDQAFRMALELGARQVVDLPGSAGWLVDTLTDLTDRGAGRGPVVGVIGGSGGAGASTLACALAQWAARSTTAAVVDCDPQGPGLDRLLGVERCEGFRWDALCRTTGRLSARALREALPSRDGLGVLSWYAGSAQQTLQAFAVREALSAARRGHGAVVVDLPRSGEAQIGEVAARCDRLVVVTRASVTGVAAASRMRARFPDHPEIGVALRGDEFSPSEVARAVGAPVWAQMRDQRGIDEAVDLGFGPLRSARGPLARAAEDLWSGVLR